MNAEKRENNESASSDIEGCGDSGAEETGAATATIPKKRGRPAKANKVVKKATGRGRGRPPKNGGGVGGGSGAGGGGDASPTELANGSKRGNSGRGRPPKVGKQKVSHSIVGTGKGRGRPKNSKNAAEADEDEGDDEEFAGSRLTKKDASSPTKRSPGRPRKVVVPSDDDEDASDDDKDDDEERRTVGRPATGAVNLNIARTGRGQGRPKKSLAKKRGNESSPEGSPKKRGRPTTVKTNPAATGTGRGRPKSKRASSPEDEDDDSKDDSEIDDKDDEDTFKSPIKVDDAESGDSDEQEFTNIGKKHRELTADQLAAA